MKRLFGLLLLGTLVAQPSYAATLYLDPSFSTLARGDAEVVAIRLDTDELQDECINAVEGVLVFDGPITPVDISLGNSIFSIWIEPPTINQAAKEVTFAGGIPNGYCGRIEGDPRLTNTLFEVIVRTDSVAAVDDQPVTAQISFTNQTQAYENDGFGTRAQLQLLSKDTTVLPQLSIDVLDPWKVAVSADQQPPQEFSIQLVQQPLLYNGRYYITFNTTDKQTGLDRYEVMEEPVSGFSNFNWGSASAPWVEARSPYVLQDQNLNSIIRVKAIDKAGNEYIATYVPDEALRTMPLAQTALLTLLGTSILVLLFGMFRFYKRRQQLREEEALEKLATQPLPDTFSNQRHQPTPDQQPYNHDNSQ